MSNAAFKMKTLFKKLFYAFTLVPFLIFASEEVVEPQNYKMDQFRSAVPATLTGATVVDSEQAKILHESGQVKFIDVLPSPKQPPGMKEGDIWLPKKRFNIPDSIWLADVGYGVLSDEIEAYFKSNLREISQGGYDGLLFYCLTDCWMSWNAAKRAIQMGYSDVYWFPGGVDEWALKGFRLEESNAHK